MEVWEVLSFPLSFASSHSSSSTGLLGQARVLFDESKKFAVPNFRLTWEAAAQFGPDLILAGITSLSESLAVGQKLRVPVVAGCTVPFYPTYQWSPVASLAKPLPLGLFNSLVHWASFKGLWAFLQEPINAFRAELDLPPQPHYYVDAAPLLCLFSETVVPRPSDWPTDLLEITGYCNVPSGAVAYEPSQVRPQSFPLSLRVCY